MKRVDHVGASEKFIADEKHIQFHDKRPGAPGAE